MMSSFGLGGSLTTPSTVASSVAQLPSSTAPGLSGSASATDPTPATMTPLLTPITAELSHLVQNFRDFLKSNRAMADLIAAENHSTDLQDSQKCIETCVDRCQQSGAPIDNCLDRAITLKDQCRREFRFAEAIEHAVGSSAVPFVVAVLLEFMSKKADEFEKAMNAYARQIAYYEDALSSRNLNGSCNLKDCLLQLKQLDQLLQTTESNAKWLHERIEDLKEIALLIQPSRPLFQSAAPRSKPSVLQGPSPFEGGARTDSVYFKNAMSVAGSGSGPFDGRLTQQSSLFGPRATTAPAIGLTSSSLGLTPFSTPPRATLSFGSTTLGHNSASLFASPPFSQSTAVVKPFGK